MDLDKKNPEGYLDMTAYLAIKKSEGKKMELFAGDIVEVDVKGGKEIREFLILAVHERTSSVLMLTDYDDMPMAVHSRTTKYTNPNMVQYIFNNAVVEYVKSISQPELTEIMKKVGHALNIPIAKSEAEAEPKVIEQKVVEKEIVKAPDDYQQALIERDIYKNLYYEMLKKVMG